MYKKGIYEIRSNEPLTGAVIHCVSPARTMRHTAPVSGSFERIS